jgi:hypothetical protein
MRRVVLLSLLVACGEDFADDHNTVDSSDGFLAGAGTCGCLINTDQVLGANIQLDCVEATDVEIALPPPDVTIAMVATGLVSDDCCAYLVDQGGVAVVTMGDVYKDPRGAPFDEQWRDVYVESLVLPAQYACDPVRAGHCIDFPRSTMRGVRAHCELSP